MSRPLAILLTSLLCACNGGGSSDAGTDGPAADLPRIDAPGIDAPPCADADGDGHGAIACGGDDCDDGDPTRYPTNVEVCDPSGHDEDCNSGTLGPDLDRDGFVYAGCCQLQSSGPTICGTDCDDTRATINPSAAEVCDGLDDNCNGLVDEGVSTVFCFDRDGDGYGDLATASSGCRTPVGATSICDDCNDADPMIHPGFGEPCNGVDDDCNGATDEGCTCTSGATQACGASVGACLAGVQHCAGGVWPSACEGAVTASVEVCDGVDDDCDGVVDEGLTFTFFADCDADGYGDDATAMQRCSAPSAAPAGCAHGVWTMTGGDCNDRDAARTPVHGCATADGGVDAGADAGSTVRDIVALSLGDGVSCARRMSGAILCWGQDQHGKLGRGTMFDTQPLPAPVPGVTDWTSLAVGGAHVCGVHAGGAVDCWGSDGTMFSSTVPTAVPGLSGIIDVAAAARHTCARDGTGAVFCFGIDANGETGSPFPMVVPPSAVITVVGISDAAQLVAGSDVSLSMANGAFSCARRVGGAVVCWGSNVAGQLGDAAIHGACAAGDCSPTAVAVTGVTDAAELAAGNAHVCARRMGGSVVCWGDNSAGQLGDGTTTSHPTPVAVTGLSDAVQIAAGGLHTCARRMSGAVVCWGDNTDGQLGDATSTNRLSPTAVLGLTDAADIAAGQTHSCARRVTNDLVCWGDNTAGELGDGTSASTTTPIPVVLP